MPEEKKVRNNDAASNENDEAVKRGQDAIAASKKIRSEETSTEKAEKEEKDDADQWHNEG